MAEQGSIIDYNGKYQSANTLSISTLNRALVYGDCVFEHIRTNASKMLFFGRHIEKLINAMQFMNMAIPKRFSTERQVLKEELTKLLIKNKIFKGGLLTLLVCSKNEGEPDYIAMVSPLPEPLFELNRQGLSIMLYTDNPVPAAPLANYNTHATGVVRTFAANAAKKIRANDALLVNNQGNMAVAAIHGAAFFVKDSILYTPALSECCVDTVMRRHVLEAADSLGIKTDETTKITPDFLKVVDEIFFASTEYGINWVGALQNRRFYRRTAEMIIKKLNEYYADEF